MATILLVDDERMNRALIRAYLRHCSHEIVEAENGARALQLAEQIRPDVVLLDILLPDIDGYEVARRLRALYPNGALPIVLVSALVDEKARARARQVGASFLSKPLNRNELIEELDTVLDQPARNKTPSS